MKKYIKNFKDLYEPSSPEDPESSAFYLNRVLERMDIDITAPESQIVIQWENIVGEHVAKHCKYSGHRNGILYVVCDHGAHAGIVRLNKGEMIKKINAVFPEFDIKNINIRVKT